MRGTQSRFDRLPTIDIEQVGRPRLRLKNPVLADGGEVIDWTLYDFFSVALGTSFNVEISLFSQPVGGTYQPVGGTAFNKTLLHTNLRATGGQLPNGYKLDIQALRLVVDQAIQYKDLDNLLYSTFVDVSIGQKDYFQGTFANLPGGVGAVLNGAASTGTPLNANGWQGNLRGIYSFSAGLEASIAYGQNFGVLVNPLLSEAGVWSSQGSGATPAGVGIRAWQHLDGVWTRPTQ